MQVLNAPYKFSLLATLFTLLVACGGGGGGGGEPTPQPTTYSVGGTVTGLTGQGLVVQNNVTDDLAIIADGTFSFATQLLDGSGYNVSVLVQPLNLSQTCQVTNGNGTLAGANITNVQINCNTNTYSIGASVSGLTGSGLVLQNNGGDDLSIDSDGTFSFSQNILSGNGYDVTVLTSPVGPSQTCTVNNSIGTVTDSDLTLLVNCSENTYTVGGTVTGLITGSGTTGVELGLNARDRITVTADGSFTFNRSLASGSTYTTSVLTQPTSPTQTCYFLNNSQAGPVTNSNITSIAVECIGPTASGNLDPNFGINGISLIDIEDRLQDDFGRAAVVLADNTILVAGTTTIGGSTDFALVRLNSDGTRDTTFNNGLNNGFVRTNISSTRDSLDYVTAMAVDNSGRILVAGSSLDGGWDLAVVRYDSNGSIDTSFANNGIALIDFGTSNDFAHAIAVFSDDSFVVAGRKLSGGFYDFALARYDASGQPDTNFNGGDISNVSGTVTTDFVGRDDYINAIAITSDEQSIIVAGHADLRGFNGDDIALAQYNATSGILDTAFGPDNTGLVTSDISNGDYGTSILLQTTGEIVVGGYVYNGTDDDFVLLRYDANGDLDSNFNTSGIVTADISGNNDEVSAIALDGGNNIIVAGNTINALNNSDFTILRYTPAGVLDTSFGTTGIITTPVGGGNDEVSAVALHPDGIVVVGQAQNGSHVDFTVIRVNP